MVETKLLNYYCTTISLYFMVHTNSFVTFVSKLWCIPFLSTIFFLTKDLFFPLFVQGKLLVGFSY